MFSRFWNRSKSTPAQIANITNGPREFAFEVVGESRCQDVLSELCGGRTEEGHRLEVDALLIPEDDNPHDENAIAVQIDGHHVGYLPRPLARSFRRAIASVAPAGTPAKCRALIVGGWHRGDDDQGHFGIRLDLPQQD